MRPGRIAPGQRADRSLPAGASPDYVLAHTGQHVGGVAPIGHPRLLRTVVDLALASYPVVGAGAGDERTVFATSFDELVRITSGTPSDVD